MNTSHYDDAKLALDAGKHCLLEKVSHKYRLWHDKVYRSVACNAQRCRVEEFVGSRQAEKGFPDGRYVPQSRNSIRQSLASLKPISFMTCLGDVWSRPKTWFLTSSYRWFLSIFLTWRFESLSRSSPQTILRSSSLIPFSPVVDHWGAIV